MVDPIRHIIELDAAAPDLLDSIVATTCGPEGVHVIWLLLVYGFGALAVLGHWTSPPLYPVWRAQPWYKQLAVLVWWPVLAVAMAFFLYQKEDYSED